MFNTNDMFVYKHVFFYKYIYSVYIYIYYRQTFLQNVQSTMHINHVYLYIRCTHIYILFLSLYGDINDSCPAGGGKAHAGNGVWFRILALIAGSQQHHIYLHACMHIYIYINIFSNLHTYQYIYIYINTYIYFYVVTAICC